jgi:HlyD family secretion protein
MKRAVVPGLLLLVVVAAGSYLFPKWFVKAPEPTELKLSGNIEAHESLVSFRVSGRIVELPVEEGQTIKAEDVLARLDSDDYRQQVAVDQAVTEVRHSQLALSMAGSRAQQLEVARQSVLDAQADLEQKKKDFTRYQALYEKDEVTGQLRDQAATSVTRATAAYDRARQIFSELQEGTRKEQLAIDRASVHQSAESLRLSRIRLGHTVLRAPFGGVVLVRQAEVGEVVAAGAPVVTIADLDHVWVRVYVPETDMGRLRWGQNVVVRADTYPGRQYRGKVSFIASEAEFTPKSVQTQKERVTLVYRVKVEVENPNLELKPGMPADAYIQLK